MPLVVDHIAGVDGLLVQPRPADDADGVGDRKTVVQLHELDGHKASGGILRILQKPVDDVARLRAGVGQNALDHVGRYLLEEVDRVVHVEFLDEKIDFLVAAVLHDALLAFRLEIREDHRGEVLGQDPEDQELLFALQLHHEFRDVDHVHLHELVLKLLDAVVPQERKELLKRNCLHFDTSLPTAGQGRQNRDTKTQTSSGLIRRSIR